MKLLIWDNNLNDNRHRCSNKNSITKHKKPPFEFLDREVYNKPKTRLTLAVALDWVQEFKFKSLLLTTLDN